MTPLIFRSSKDFENNLFGKSFAILSTDQLGEGIFDFGEILITLNRDLDSLFLLGHIYQSDCHTPRINDKNALKLLNQKHLGAQECPDRIDENAVRSKNTSRIMQTEGLDFTGKPNFSEIPTIISEYRNGIKKYEKEIRSFYSDSKEDFHKNLYTMLYENSSNGTLNDFNCKKYGFKKGSMGLIKDFFQHVIKFETPYFEFKLLTKLQALDNAGHVFIPADMSFSEKNNIKKMFLLNNEIVIEYKDKKDVIDFLKNGGQELSIEQQQGKTNRLIRKTG